MAEAHKFKYIVSSPCFERWYLLHFERGDRPHANYDSLAQQLATHIPNYDKGTFSLFENLWKCVEIAIANAQRLPNPSEDPAQTAYTDVDLVEERGDREVILAHHSASGRRLTGRSMRVPRRWPTAKSPTSPGQDEPRGRRGAVHCPLHGRAVRRTSSRTKSAAGLYDKRRGNGRAEGRTTPSGVEWPSCSSARRRTSPSGGPHPRGPEAEVRRQPRQPPLRPCHASDRRGEGRIERGRWGRFGCSG